MANLHGDEAAVCSAPLNVEQLAAAGTTCAVPVTLDAPCPECTTSGQLECSRCDGRRIVAESRDVLFPMPPNIKYGNQIRLPGQGQLRADGSRGTLVIQVVPAGAASAPVTPLTPPPNHRLNRIVLTSVAVGAAVVLLAVAVLLGERIAGLNEVAQAPNTSLAPAPATSTGDTTCLSPDVSAVTATWRPPNPGESWGYLGMEDRDKYEHVFLLDDVTVSIRNRSSHKIWIRNVNILNRWTDEFGRPRDNQGFRSAGWYASLVPKPPSSTTPNNPQWVNPGDTIAFDRDYETLGYGAEFATTSGAKPVTTVREDSIDWWFDSPDIRTTCAS